MAAARVTGRQHRVVPLLIYARGHFEHAVLSGQHGGYAGLQQGRESRHEMLGVSQGLGSWSVGSGAAQVRSAHECVTICCKNGVAGGGVAYGVAGGGVA